MNILLAFDSSTKATGVAIFKDGKYVRSGVIRIDDKNNLADDRIPLMIRDIYKTIDIVKPAVVVFEDVRKLNNTHTTVSLSEILGAIIGKCLQLGIYYDHLGPTEWRQVHGIQGGKATTKELKARQVAKVKELYGKDVTHDEADAILLGSAYMEIKGE